MALSRIILVEYSFVLFFCIQDKDSQLLFQKQKNLKNWMLLKNSQ